MSSETTPLRDPKRVAAFFAEVSRELMEQGDEYPTADKITERASEVVGGCDFASISLRRRHHQTVTIASTGEVARFCDDLQYELGEGPCLDAVWHTDVTCSCDVSHDDRWPKWGPRVAEKGVASVISVRLSSATETLGALNLYSGRADAFGPDELDLALIFAAHAANAMNAAQALTGLQTALHSRHLIGVAQGVLMHKYDLSLDQAFEVLRRYSNQHNLKLREVAQFVVDNRNLPDSGASA